MNFYTPSSIDYGDISSCGNQCLWIIRICKNGSFGQNFKGCSRDSLYMQDNSLFQKLTFDFMGKGDPKSMNFWFFCRHSKLKLIIICNYVSFLFWLIFVKKYPVVYLSLHIKCYRPNFKLAPLKFKTMEFNLIDSWWPHGHGLPKIQELGIKRSR